MKHKVKTVVYCDGACWPNPGGRGGWGAVIQLDGELHEISGGEQSTTSNRMEVMAAIEGVRRAIELGAKAIVVRSDSQYLVQGAGEWVYSWRIRGWRTSFGEPVKNQDLWHRILELSSTVYIRWQHVRGHSGDPLNERAHELAEKAAGIEPLGSTGLKVSQWQTHTEETEHTSDGQSRCTLCSRYITEVDISGLCYRCFARWHWGAKTPTTTPGAITSALQTG